MTEPLFHNRRPLGQKAKELLQDPDPEVLYVVQLAQSVLQNPRAIPGQQERRNAQLMLELVNQLVDKTPTKAQRLFLGPDYQKVGSQQAGEEQLLQGDQDSLGVRLVENLYANLANQSPSLNPAHSLT